MFSYLSPEALVPTGHPLRLIRPVVNAALDRLSAEFDTLYASGGRDSIAPGKLLRALLLQAFYSVRGSVRAGGGNSQSVLVGFGREGRRSWPQRPTPTKASGLRWSPAPAARVVLRHPTPNRTRTR